MCRGALHSLRRVDMVHMEHRGDRDHMEDNMMGNMGPGWSTEVLGHTSFPPSLPLEQF